MDFIEHLFGISPDGGSGATELSLILVPIFVVAYLAVRRYRMRKAAGSLRWKS